MPHVSAYEWHGRIFLHPDSKTRSGFWIGTEPVWSVDPDNLIELGRGILSALAVSKEGVPDPSIWADLCAPLLKSAGAKSSSAFFASARSVSIQSRGDEVIFSPHRNLGSKEGYRPIQGKDRTSSVNVSELGAALLSAFRDSE
jgi:hypothetical protein